MELEAKFSKSSLVINKSFRTLTSWSTFIIMRVNVGTESSDWQILSRITNLGIDDMKYQQQEDHRLRHRYHGKECLSSSLSYRVLRQQKKPLSAPFLSLFEASGGEAGGTFVKFSCSLFFFPLSMANAAFQWQNKSSPLPCNSAQRRVFSCTAARSNSSSSSHRKGLAPAVVMQKPGQGFVTEAMVVALSRWSRWWDVYLSWLTPY